MNRALATLLLLPFVCSWPACGERTDDAADSSVVTSPCSECGPEQYCAHGECLEGNNDGTLGCIHIHTCVEACLGDQSCVDECLDMGTQKGKEAADALSQCLEENNCRDGFSGDCALAHCKALWTVCVVDGWRAASCNVMWDCYAPVADGIWSGYGNMDLVTEDFCWATGVIKDQQLMGALVQCIENNHCEDNACIEERCDSELNACGVPDQMVCGDWMECLGLCEHFGYGTDCTDRCNLKATAQAAPLGAALVQCIQQSDWQPLACGARNGSDCELQDYSDLVVKCSSELNLCLADTIDGGDSFCGELPEEASRAEGATLGCKSLLSCQLSLLSRPVYPLCRYACWDRVTDEARQLGGALAQCIVESDCETLQSVLWPQCIETECESEYNDCQDH